MKPSTTGPSRLRFLPLVLVGAVFIAGCSSDDDDMTPPDTSNDVTIVAPLSSTITVPPANVDGAGGEANFTINTDTGAVTGAATVTGTTGTPTVAHIHSGAPGEAGPPLITLEPDATGNVWSAGANAALDAAGIALFQAGNTYVNVHTDANPAGELRAQLVEPGAPAAGSYTITLRNTSTSQPMTPPVVALHTPQSATGGIRLFEVGQPAIAEVIDIAENGNFQPLVDVATGQTGTTVSAAGVGLADPDNPGPLAPGASATLTLDPGAATDQVLSIVSMVVCTNDGFTGVDSLALPDTSTTFTAPIYDAGSETNVLTLDYWVPPCGGTGNLGDEEGGVITAHPGQTGSENADFDFPAGSEFLEVTVTRN